MSYEKRAARFGVWCALGVITGLTGCSDGEKPLGGETSNQGTEPETRLRDPLSRQVLPQAGSAQQRSTSPSAAAGARNILAKTNVRLLDGQTRRLDTIAATGLTADIAAEKFRKSSSAILGVDAADLMPTRLGGAAPRLSTVVPADAGVGLMYNRATGKYKFRLYTYEQQRDGIPVFRGGLRTLVRDDGNHPVVWANADVRPMGSFRPDSRVVSRSADVEKSLQAARRSVIDVGGLPPSGLVDVSKPTPTIFAGVGERTSEPKLAMSYSAKDASGAGKWTFVADAETGEVLHVESHLHFDVNGTVQAEATGDTRAMECGDLEVAPLPYVEVTSGANSAFTDLAGAFTVAGPSSGSVTVSASVAGQYFDVINNAGATTSASLTVTPPGPANFLFADSVTPPELVLAEVNAYKHANDLRDMLLTYLPDYPVIAGQTDFPIHVNRTDFTCETTGGAWYDNDSSVRSINFCQRTAERANTAFGGIIHHEYGHHIIDAGGSQQSQYGEGMSDAIAMLFTKDPRIGMGYRLDCDEPLRLASNNCQYSETECSSCGAGIYECGALLSGTIWDIWQQLDVTEPEDADDIIRSLVFSSIPMHTGSSVDPSIAVDMLTLDDDDGLLENGTPHYDEICAGFELHGMSCPPIVGGLVVKSADLSAEGPSGGPFAPSSVSYTLYNLGPEESLTYAVTNPSNATWLSVDSTGGTIALGGEVTVTVSIDQTQAALLPDGDYTAGVHFVNSTSGVGSVIRETKLRVGAPEPVFTATFDGDLDGFTVGSEYGNLWHVATTCVDALPGHSSGGSLYYGKGDICNYTTPVPIEHTVTSAAIPVATRDMAELGFNYLLETENDADYDSAFVSVSVNGGPFTIVASNNRGAELLIETRTWRAVRFSIADLLPETGAANIRVQFAFNAGDPTSNTKTGFAVDDLVVYAKAATCMTNTDCDDGAFCNGAETCVEQECVAGTAITCDDGVECTSDSCDEEANACVYVPGNDCGSSNVFVESNGTVVMEAEHFASNTPRSSHSWDEVTNTQASGQAVMTANPNSGDFINSNYAVTSPELTYAVNFANTGTYYVWIRGIGPNGNDDSCHFGVDGNEVGSADRISTFNAGLSWSRSTMDGPVATIQVTSAGIHEVNLWMREDGFSADKIILTKSSSFVPTGSGPQESPFQGSPQGNPCDNFCDAPVTFGTSNYSSGNLGTEARCFETTAPINGGVCGNFVSPRRLYVNGVEMTCNWSSWGVIPAAANGGYCIHTTAGNQPWAAFTTW